MQSSQIHIELILGFGLLSSWGTSHTPARDDDLGIFGSCLVVGARDLRVRHDTVRIKVPA